MGNESKPIRVAVMGLGSTGRSIVKAVLAQPELSLAGVVDSNPSRAGRPLAELVSGAPPDLRVTSRLEELLPRLRQGVLLQASGPWLDTALPSIRAAVEAGLHVVSTCAELTFPWVSHEARAHELEELAERKGVSVLGVGVNPGFVFDRLVSCAGAVCGPVRHVHCERVVEARTLRESLRRRAGLGLSEAEMEKRLDEGEVGHVGLVQSVALAAVGLGLECDDIEEDLQPLLAEERLEGDFPLAPGQVAGIYQRARGFIEGREVVDLELTIAAGVDATYDLIRIDADPGVELRISGGYPDEQAIGWAVAHAVPRVAASEPGILTVLDLPAGR